MLILLWVTHFEAALCITQGGFGSPAPAFGAGSSPTFGSTVGGGFGGGATTFGVGVFCNLIITYGASACIAELF